MHSKGKEADGKVRSVSHPGAETSETKRMVIITLGDQLHTWRIFFPPLCQSESLRMRCEGRPTPLPLKISHKAHGCMTVPTPCGSGMQMSQRGGPCPFSIRCNGSRTVSLCNVRVTGRRSECRTRGRPGGDGESGDRLHIAAQRAKSGAPREAQKRNAARRRAHAWDNFSVDEITPSK